ncbi:MAG: DnaJ domain-containing protein [Campylobacterota bacterium]|nr:DnaJ domain-containing protein [Campylobacterota bacterium]
MQILLGMNETVIRVYDRVDNVNFIFEFIEKSFSNKLIKSNSIYLNYTHDEHYKRLFLLKWFYQMYSKNSNTDAPLLKQHLHNRVKKPIRIEIIKQQCYHYPIFIHILNNSTIKFKIVPKNIELYSFLTAKFRANLINSVESMHMFDVLCDNYESKQELSEIIKHDTLESLKVKFIYNATQMREFLATNDDVEIVIKGAYDVLESSPDESLKVIKKRYKKLLKKFHPDNVFCEDKSQVELYTQKFQLIQNAYTLIREAS